MTSPNVAQFTPADVVLKPLSCISLRRIGDPAVPDTVDQDVELPVESIAVDVSPPWPFVSKIPPPRKPAMNRTDS